MQGTQQQRVIEDVFTRLRRELAELGQHIEQQRRPGSQVPEVYAGMRRSCQAIRDAAHDLDTLIRNA